MGFQARDRERPDQVISDAARLVAVRFGRTHDRRYTRLLRDLVVSGRARPGAFVTHHGSLADAPDLYQRFDRREDGVIALDRCRFRPSAARRPEQH